MDCILLASQSQDAKSMMAIHLQSAVINMLAIPCMRP